VALAAMTAIVLLIVALVVVVAWTMVEEVRT